MKFSIVIPAYNEGVHIERIARDIHDELKKVEMEFEVIVVDNGSSDNTQAVLQDLQKELPRIKACTVFPNRGYGGGILAGLAMAEGEALGWTDGDGQVPAAAIAEMYKQMKEGDLTFVKARRVTRYDGLFRYIQSLVFNSIFRVLFMTSVGDVNAKPKLFKRSFYSTIQLVCTDMFIDAEIVIKALRAGLTIKEYPIVFESRKEGVSKIRLSAGLEFLKNLFYFRFVDR